MKQVCENCKWWRKVEHEDIDGKESSQCRRFPPMVEAGSKKGAFPMTAKDAFCGEFVA